MSAVDAIDTDVRLVEAALEDYFARQIERAGAYSERYRTLWTRIAATTRGGKRLRPRMVLGPYRALGGTDIDTAVEFAVALELLHTALLQHDDVIDGDIERRGMVNVVGAFRDDALAAGIDPVAAQRWGDASALLAGDLLIAAAHRITAELRTGQDKRAALMALLDESVFRAAAGEHADVAFAMRLEAGSADSIIAMMADKTAHYSLELPLRAAAILAGADAVAQDRLGRIGRAIGVVFQMRDDLLGVFGDSAVTGKSTLGDLREGKRTLLIEYAEGTPEWGAVAEAFGDPLLDEGGAAVLRAALESSGARAHLEAAIDRDCEGICELIGEGEFPAALAEILAEETTRAGRRWV